MLTGRYRARVCAFNDILCYNPGDCDDIPTGPTDKGEPTGNYICYGTEFEIPFEEEALEIIISEYTVIVV